MVVRRGVHDFEKEKMMRPTEAIVWTKIEPKRETPTSSLKGILVDVNVLDKDEENYEIMVTADYHAPKLEILADERHRTLIIKRKDKPLWKMEHPENFKHVTEL